MGKFSVTLALAITITGVLLFLFWPRPVFVIRIADGKARSKRGRIPKGFLSECELLAGENNIKNATIRGVKKRGSVHLTFSGQIPDAAVQRFRNIWRQYA